jgi:hypothetical protein
MMNRIFFSLVLLIPLILNAQVEKFNLPPKTVYNRGKITLIDFTKYEGKKLFIMPESISFIHVSSNLNQSIMLSEIDYIRVQEGTQALTWCGYGALFMGLVALLNVIDEPYIQNPGGLVVGFTISGAVIGGLIGLAIPKWKTYYLKY